MFQAATRVVALRAPRHRPSCSRCERPSPRLAVNTVWPSFLRSVAKEGSILTDAVIVVLAKTSSSFTSSSKPPITYRALCGFSTLLSFGLDRMTDTNSNSRITTRLTRHTQTGARTPNPHLTLICAHLPLKQGTESNCRQKVGTKLWEHSNQRHYPSQPGRTRDDLKMCFKVHGGTADRSGASRDKWAVNKLHERVVFIDHL